MGTTNFLDFFHGNICDKKLKNFLVKGKITPFLTNKYGKIETWLKVHTPRKNTIKESFTQELEKHGSGSDLSKRQIRIFIKRFFFSRKLFYLKFKIYKYFSVSIQYSLKRTKKKRTQKSVKLNRRKIILISRGLYYCTYYIPG